MQPPIQALGGLVLKALLISHLLTQPPFNALKFTHPVILNSAAPCPGPKKHQIESSGKHLSSSHS